MEKQSWNNIIGFVLIFIILLGWSYFMKPDPKELEKIQIVKDSIAQVEKNAAQVSQATVPTPNKQNAPVDSNWIKNQNAHFGIFSPASGNSSGQFTLENNVIKLTFDSKGGRITSALLKKYDRIKIDTATRKDVKLPLYLLDDPRNKFQFLVPNGLGGTFSSSELNWSTQTNGNTIQFQLIGNNGQLITQSYTLKDGYQIDYQLQSKQVSFPNAKMELEWVNYIDKIEKNSSYEKNYSTQYFQAGEKYDYCNCIKSDELTPEKPIKWVSHSNQFFNSTIIPEVPFASLKAINLVPDNHQNAKELKALTSVITIPQSNLESGMRAKLYVGPNDYATLKSFNNGLEHIISYGSGILGSINRSVMRPLFMFIMGLIGSQGTAILILTLLVKAALFPLTYKMLISQAKMSVLKPRLASLKEKHKDDMQAQQMETMKIYREFGVNPLGGCLPMLLQMPIWIALYRFFPSSLEFRQASFLWANDLSSYDDIIKFSFGVPFLDGHLSIFTLLWTITTIWYSWYTMKDQDFSAMQGGAAMKYMQYFFPLVFFFMFNNFASGLTSYLFLSNVINVGQNVLTKKYFINHEKLKQQLDAFKAKPKKQSSWQKRFEEVMKEQRRLQEEKLAKSKKK